MTARKLYSLKARYVRVRLNNGSVNKDAILTIMHPDKMENRKHLSGNLSYFFRMAQRLMVLN